MINKLAVEYNAPKAIYPTGTHVMKYAVDKDAISFKLNNGVVQVCIQIIPIIRIFNML